MNNLFDSSIDDGSSVCTRESRDSDQLAFAVATVCLTNQSETKSPHANTTNNRLYNDDEAIVDAEDERDKLRITTSLMDCDDDDDDDESIDPNDDNADKHKCQEDIFRLQNNDLPAANKTASYITLGSWKSINLLDDASATQSKAESEALHKSHSYSDKFNAVYEEVATIAATNKQSSASINNGRFQNARHSLSTAVRSFGVGLSNATACDAVGTTFPMVASSWDVDDSSQISGKKRVSSDTRFGLGHLNKRKRPLDIRSELVLMQDKMDNYERTIQSLQHHNSDLTQAKSNLQLMLDQSNNALRTAQLATKVSQDQAETLTIQLNEMKNELHEARRDVVKIRKENDEAKEAVKERIRALEGELDLKMKREKDRHQIEIMSLKAKVNSAENTVEECQEVIERQAEKIVKLEITLADTTTAATDALEMAKEAEEERDLWKKRAMLSPKAKTLAKSFVHTSSYFSCENQQQLTPTRSIGKENKNNNAIGRCSLCFKGQSGITRWCKCGKDECKEWAHAQCLAKRKSNVSSSVSHPGTPPPPLPLILCSGIHQ